MRLSELYTSTQGEGPRVGKPTQFVRFGGCNLRCPGWPCDTQYAIDPKYRQEWKRVSAGDLEDMIAPWPPNICLTGGEPFLQPSSELQTVVGIESSLGFTIEAFTNGTLPWPEWTRGDYTFVSMVMDYKLPGSGEDALVNTKVRNDNIQMLTPSDALKFTIVDEFDFQVAYQAWLYWQEQLRDVPIYAGVVWRKEMTNEHLVDLIMKHQLPWLLNVQVHKVIWTPEMRGV